MEHLKLIMEKLELMNEEEKLNNEEYVFLMEHIGKAYKKHNVGKFVKVMEIKPNATLYWKTKYNSGIHTHTSWAHNSDCDEDCECGNCEDSFPITQAEYSVSMTDTIIILKIIEEEEYPILNTKNNTISNDAYEKLKEKKADNWGNKWFVFIEDVE